MRKAISSTIFRTKEIKLEGKLAQFLCACANYKIQDINVRNADPNEKPIRTFSFDEFFQQTSFQKSTMEMYFKPYCNWIPSYFYRYLRFPATYCRLDEYLIAKGLVNAKSGQKQLYVIYVSKVTAWYDDVPKYLMKGIFSEVDLEMLEEKIVWER